jgi:hypothetical protein
MNIKIADLQAFADAWNRHDIEALMRRRAGTCYRHPSRQSGAVARVGLVASMIIPSG